MSGESARHQDRLGGRRRCFPGEIGQLGACRLSEHRHGVGNVRREVDIAKVQGLQQRQAAGELVPGHANALGLQALFESAPGLQQGQQGRGFLVADAQGLLGAGKAWQQGAGEQRQAQLAQGFKGHEYVSEVRVALQAWRRREG